MSVNYYVVDYTESIALIYFDVCSKMPHKEPKQNNNSPNANLSLV